LLQQVYLGILLGGPKVLPLLIVSLAYRTNGRAIATLLRLSSVCL